MSFVVFDVWTHAQDVRPPAGLQCIRDEEQVAVLAVVGLQCIRDEEQVAVLTVAALNVFSRVYPGKRGPTLSVVVDEADGFILGEDEPVVTSQTTAYELMRIVFGRRSRAQVEQACWKGDRIPEAIDGLHLFDFPPIDIVEP